MATNRKTIRITIPSESVQAFNDAKKRAEDAAMCTFTDTQYASRLVTNAVMRAAEEGKPQGK